VTARYRLVHFVADPFTGARVPIAAIVDAGGRLEVTKAPDAATGLGLGRRASTRATIEFVLDSISSVTTFDELPPTTGPQVTLGPAREAPVAPKDAVKWVRTALLREPLKPEPRELGRPGRKDAGYRFLEQWKVAKWVGREFRAEDYFQQFSLVLPQISQYVRGDSKLLLMEPIVAKRESSLFRVLRHIGTTFMAWQHGFEQARKKPEVDYIAYVVAVEEHEMVDEARRVLDKSGTTVLDVNATTERTKLLESIRRTALAAQA
jgi:hypothetical protein